MVFEKKKIPSSFKARPTKNSTPDDGHPVKGSWPRGGKNRRVGGTHGIEEGHGWPPRPRKQGKWREDEDEVGHELKGNPGLKHGRITHLRARSNQDDVLRVGDGEHGAKEKGKPRKRPTNSC